MPNIKTHKWLWFLQVALLLLACEAPHKNPLDPANSDVEYRRLSGAVYSNAVGHQALVSATVIWRNQGRIVFSGQNGRWEISAVPPDDGWLVFAAAGFASDSIWVEWPNTADFSTDMYLNPAPGISGTLVSAADQTPLAGGIVRWAPDNIYTVSDANGNFTITVTAPNDGWLAFYHEGFVPDSVLVSWGDEAQIVQNFALEPLTSTRLSGHVHTNFGNAAPLAGVQVSWPVDGRFTETDAAGNFELTNITNKNGWLYFSHTGFKPDSLFVTWAVGQSEKSVDFALNGIPKLTDFQIYSMVEFDYPARKTMEIQVTAGIDDEERDTETVFIRNEALNMQVNLDYNPQTKLWEKTLYSYHFPLVNSLRDLVGYDFSLNISDSAGDTLCLGTERIERFVLDEIEIEAPLGGSVVSPTPELTWQPFFPGFDFSYTIEIYTDDYFNRELKYQRNFAPASSFTHTVETSLEAGKYFWVIWCIDSFNNQSRSKPATFTVTE